MKGDYGEHIADLAGYGVEVGELRDYEEFEEDSVRSSADEEAATSLGQATRPENPVAGNLGAVKGNLSGGVKACVKETGFQRQKEFAGRNRKSLTCEESPAQNALPVSATLHDSTASVPAEAEESLAEWIDNRDRIQDAHDAEEAAWSEQARLQAAGDDGEKERESL